MKIEGVSNDSIQKTGPNPQEIKTLREMHANGASVKDFIKAFPDIVEEALVLWFASLEAEKLEAEEAAKPKKPAPPAPPAPPAEKKPDPLK